MGLRRYNRRLARDGAQESQAQRLEEDLWQQFIVWRKVDSGRGVGYLRLLRKRRELQG